MKIQIVEVWSTVNSLVFKCEIWGADGSWRQKRYATLPFESIPDEVMTDWVGHWMDRQPEENHQQTALF